MIKEPSLPPIYTLRVVEDDGDSSREVARLRAGDGAEAGEFVWAAREDRFDCAVVLRPDESVDAAQHIVLIAALSLIDALGATVPAGIEADIVWPGKIRVNGGMAGGGSMDFGPDGDAGRFEWLVAGAWLRIHPQDDREGGERPDITSLREEGCADIDSRWLAETFGKAFLSWMDRWRYDGFGPIRGAWMNWATIHGDETVLTIGPELLAGRIEGLDDDGGLILETSSGMRTLPLTREQAAAET